MSATGTLGMVTGYIANSFLLAWEVTRGAELLKKQQTRGLYGKAVISAIYVYMGRGSSVGIATRYGLDGPGIESRWGGRFSAPVQTGPGAQPASCTMGTGPFQGVKRPERGVDHPPHPWSRVLLEKITSKLCR